MKPSRLAPAIHVVLTELSHRYGQAPGGATAGQLNALVRDLSLAEDLAPYLQAVFLSEEAFRLEKLAHPERDWSRVERDAQAAYSSLQHVSPGPEGFNESGKGYPGVGAT